MTVVLFYLNKSLQLLYKNVVQDIQVDWIARSDADLNHTAVNMEKLRSDLESWV